MPERHESITESGKLAEPGKYEDALLLLKRVIKNDASNATAWFNLDIIQFKRGSYREAINAFGQATEIDREFANVWFNKGRALAMLGKKLEDIRAFEKVLLINPHDNGARAGRDEALEKIAHIPKGQVHVSSTARQTQLRE